MRIFHVLVVLALASVFAGLPPAHAAQRDSTPAQAEDLADAALDVISTRYPTPHENYFVLVCTPDRKQALAIDADIGAYYRYMREANSDLAVVVLPSAPGAGATYVVYFSSGAAVGLAAVDATKTTPTDAVVAAAYGRVQPPVAKRSRRVLYQPGVIMADDGTAVDALKIVGWR